LFLEGLSKPLVRLVG